MTRKHRVDPIRAAAMTIVLLGVGLAPVTAIATPNSYEECIKKIFRTDACADTSWWSDSACQLKSITECGLK